MVTCGVPDGTLVQVLIALAKPVIVAQEQLAVSVGDDVS
jgi:hypothetical protein